MNYAFSDGNPIWEYSVFLVIFGLSCGLAFLKSTQSLATWITSRLAALIRRRHALPEHGLIADLFRIDIIRIIVGGIAAHRYSAIFSHSLASGNELLIGMSAFASIAALFVMLGFLTPFAAFLLMSTGNLIVDNFLGASTLGTMVMSMTLLLILLAPAGRTLSLDAYLATRAGASRRIVATLHKISGPVSEDRLLVAKMAALFAYYCVCLYSVSWHTNDDAWRSGLVIAWVMLSPTANPKYSAMMWQLYQASPWLYVSFAKLSIYGMFIWYALTLPGIFMGRLIRGFVILWGLAFFLISTFVLPLSFLGWYELALWFALFASGSVFGCVKGPSLAILFDDRCNLCDRTVKILARLDLFGRLEFRPIRRNMDFAAANGVTLQQGLTDLVGVDLQSGEKTAGFALYDQITTKLLFLWPLKPLFWLSSLTGIGPKLYRWVADRRTKLFGVCEFSNIPDRFLRSPVLHLNDNLTRPARRHSVLTTATVSTLLVLAAAFLIRLPILSTEPDNRPVASFAKNLFGAAPAAFGIHKINVFNTADLALFRFSMIKYVYPEGMDLSQAIVSEEDAAKRDYLAFTGSDAQLYGITAQLRRMSRMNLGCDREFFDSALAILRSAYVSKSKQVPTSDVVLEFDINTWPTIKDFSSYSVIVNKSWPLCRARVNLESGAIKDFVFVQSGIDEAFRQKSFPAIIDAKHAETAIRFPCRYDAFFMSALSKQHPEMANDIAFINAINGEKEDKFGRFNTDCLMDAWDIAQKWPQLFDTGKIAADVGMCMSGLGLLHELSKANPLDKLVSRQMTFDEATVSAYADRGDILGCVQHAAAGWKNYWRGITKADDLGFVQNFTNILQHPPH
jgi:predicted DCC family thiol-disulfide oxidoreductase YuxK